MPTLFDPARFGDIALANRVVMAPLTRDRAGPRQVPTGLMRIDCKQRAGAGLAPHHRCRARARRAQRGAAVAHGAQSYVWLLPPGRVPVAGTDRAARTKTFTAAGFDGVEVHGANGYLIEQFLRDSINDRRDACGGAPEHRVRELVEVMTAIATEIGAGRGGPRDSAPFGWADLRAPFKDGHEAGGWIVNNGYARSMAQDAVAAGRAAAVAFGKAFSANPDLVERQRRDAPLAEAKRATFYGGGAEGYTDDTALAD